MNEIFVFLLVLKKLHVVMPVRDGRSKQFGVISVAGVVWTCQKAGFTGAELNGVSGYGYSESQNIDVSI